MLNNEHDQIILSDLEYAKKDRDWETLLNFYGELFQLQFDFKTRLAKLDQAAKLREKEINLHNLTDGVPQIAFPELDMASAPFMELYHRVLELLIPYTGCSVSEEDQQPEMVLDYAREVFISRGPLVVSGSPMDINKTAGGFVLAPYLQLACECIMPRIEQSAWHRSYCPICGGFPSFAAINASGSRTLLCPRCHGEWIYVRVGCPFCKNGESQAYYPDEEGKYRLYVCDACQRYLKIVDIREGRSALSLPIENILTISMDIAAQEKGYRPY